MPAGASWSGRQRWRGRRQRRRPPPLWPKSFRCPRGRASARRQAPHRRACRSSRVRPVKILASYALVHADLLLDDRDVFEAGRCLARPTKSSPPSRPWPAPQRSRECRPESAPTASASISASASIAAGGPRRRHFRTSVPSPSAPRPPPPARRRPPPRRRRDYIRLHRVSTSTFASTSADSICAQRAVRGAPSSGVGKLPMWCFRRALPRPRASPPASCCRCTRLVPRARRRAPEHNCSPPPPRERAPPARRAPQALAPPPLLRLHRRLRRRRRRHTRADGAKLIVRHATPARRVERRTQGRRRRLGRRRVVRLHRSLALRGERSLSCLLRRSSGAGSSSVAAVATSSGAASASSAAAPAASTSIVSSAAASSAAASSAASSTGGFAAPRQATARPPTAGSTSTAPRAPRARGRRGPAGSAGSAGTEARQTQPPPVRGHARVRAPPPPPCRTRRGPRASTASGSDRDAAQTPS